MTRNFFCISLLLLLSCTYSFTQDFSSVSECEDCRRLGTLLGVKAYDPSDLYGSFTDENGYLTSFGEEQLFSSFSTHLPELCDPYNNCFRFQGISAEELAEFKESNSDFEGIGSRWTSAEYGFKIDIETGLPGTEPHPVNGRPVVSSLKLEMYFLGETQELVNTWTALGTLTTDGIGQSTYGSLDNQLTSLIKNGPPYHTLAYDFEKKPVMCNVSPNKHSLEKGEEVEITISNFRDSKGQPSREFNRILVHVNEGEILNGEKSAAGTEYRVFRLDEQSITVKYRAPEKGSATTDIITVYNSCEILPLNKSPLRTTKPDKQIATRELNLMHFAWSGNINIEITERFYCMEEEETSELGRREVRANDEIRTLADISVGLDDFDLAGQSTNAGSMLKYASGNLTLNLREDHYTKGYAEKTQCHNENSGKWEWRSPGNWSTRNTIKSAKAYRDIKKENIIMLIMKDVGVDQTSMENLQQQLQEAAQRMDLKAIESLKGKMTNMVQGDNNSNTFPVRIQVQLTFSGDITDLVYTTYESESNDVCNSENNKKDSSSDAGQVNIVAPVTVMMEGTYIRGENGNDMINASSDLPPETRQGGFFSNICPDKTVTLKANIQLERKKE